MIEGRPDLWKFLDGGYRGVELLRKADRGRWGALRIPTGRRFGLSKRLIEILELTSEPDVTDGGFVGADLHRHWRADSGAQVICPPGRTARQPWPAALRRWHSGLRQIIETVNDALLLTFGLDAERPHALGGFQARLAARVALHNFCCWLNRHLGRPCSPSPACSAGKLSSTHTKRSRRRSAGG